MKDQINITATVGKIIKSDKSGHARVVLENVKIDGKEFKDHSWISLTKRMYFLNVGDVITCTGELTTYPNSNDADLKTGIKKVRNIKVLYNLKGDLQI